MHDDLFSFIFKAFGVFGFFAVIAWVVSAIDEKTLASLALVGVIIYFLIKAANFIG